MSLNQVRCPILAIGVALYSILDVPDLAVARNIQMPVGSRDPFTHSSLRRAGIRSYLDETPFPPVILDRLAERIDVLSRIGPECHTFFNEALTGHLLKGSRERRWRDPRSIVNEQRGT